MFVWLYLPHLCCTLKGHHSWEWFCGELCAKTSVMRTQNFEHLKIRCDWLSKIFVDTSIDLPKYVWDDRKDIQNEFKTWLDSETIFNTHNKILVFSMSEEDSWGSTPHKVWWHGFIPKLDSSRLGHSRHLKKGRIPKKNHPTLASWRKPKQGTAWWSLQSSAIRHASWHGGFVASSCFQTTSWTSHELLWSCSMSFYLMNKNGWTPPEFMHLSFTFDSAARFIYGKYVPIGTDNISTKLAWSVL